MKKILLLLIIGFLILILFSMCKLSKQLNSDDVQLSSINKKEKQGKAIIDLEFIDTIEVNGYFCYLKKNSFDNHNSGWLLIDSLDLGNIVSQNSKKDLYEFLISKNYVPILYVSESDFPYLKWNLMNPGKQRRNHLYNNIPKTILTKRAFFELNFGTFSYKIKEPLGHAQGKLKYADYDIKFEKVKVSGIKMRVNRDIGLPIWDGSLERKSLDENGKMDVFIPMEIIERKNIEEEFYLTYFD